MRARILRSPLIVASLAVALAAAGTACTIPTSADRATSQSATRASTTEQAPTAITTDPTDLPFPTASPPAAQPALPPTAADACHASNPKLDCDMQQRISTTNSYIGTRPGTVGFVLHDRLTGATYRNDQSAIMVWTASTIKLAMAVDLFTRDRSGAISLSDEDRTLIQQMLHSSDDDAADTLWYRYSGADHLEYNNAFPTYGMTHLEPQQGFSNDDPYWGFQKCTPEDLDQLVQYVLSRMDAADSSYIIGELQRVADNQQWGVWAAGADMQAGNKDGWSDEDSGWVINSVGFAGPSQRYTLAIMNSLDGEGGYDDGVETDSHVARLLLAGRT